MYSKRCLQHWKLNYIYTFLDSIIKLKKCQYILICNCCPQVEDRIDNIDGGLSANFYPLKKYNAKIIFKYNTKEISVKTI